MKGNVRISLESSLKINKDTVLFFDLDDTLINTNYANYLSYEKAIQSVCPLNPDIFYDSKIRFNRGLLKGKLPNLTESKLNKIIQRKEEYFKEFLSQTKLNNPVFEVLMKYSKTNKTVLVTNCRMDRAIMILNYHRLGYAFSNLFFSRLNDTNRKTNKFENAILNLNIAPQSIIAFENDESEITDALAAGILFINPFKLKYE